MAIHSQMFMYSHQKIAVVDVQHCHSSKLRPAKSDYDKSQISINKYLYFSNNFIHSMAKTSKKLSNISKMPKLIGTSWDSLDCLDIPWCGLINISLTGCGTFHMPTSHFVMIKFLCSQYIWRPETSVEIWECWFDDHKRLGASQASNGQPRVKPGELDQTNEE